jgi:hypothetical protein
MPTVVEISSPRAGVRFTAPLRIREFRITRPRPSRCQARHHELWTRCVSPAPVIAFTERPSIHVLLAGDQVPDERRRPGEDQAGEK